MDDTHPVRLPREVVPSRYDIEIEPDLASGTFRGRVRTAVRVATEVEAVVLNARDLDVHHAAFERDGRAEPLAVAADPATERLTLRLPNPIPPGAAVVDLAFRGRLHDDLVGFYRSTFTDDAGERHTIAATQFEAPHARRAFPCFDEPDFKAVFAVTLVVDDGLVALSNGAEVERTTLGDGRARVRFADTIPMSTYLVAFVVGPLEITPGPQGTTVPLRVAHVPGRSHLTRYALDVAAFTVDFFADYYGIPYPGDKLDLVALPDFAFGAMENLGCVTFRESLLLVDPERVTQAERTNAALTIVHEIAHMWFGDLVTMKWWNGIWLNEAFATFMEHAGVDAYRPEWRTWDDFAVARAAALEIDALASTRPVEYDVRTPEDADGMFDVLTYQKGGAVVRMLERWLGADEFRAGVRAYLDRYRYGNTETTDLWDAIEEAAGQPVRRIMDAWIFRPGFPLMEVTRTPDGVSLRQRRCRADGDDDGSRWPVPVGLRWGGGGHDGAASVLLDGDALDLTIPSGARWVVANRGGHGFYRTQYDGTSARDLLAAGVLDAAERFTIVDDTWAAVVRGDTTATEFLSLAQSCGEEIDLVVWRALLAHLRDASRLLGGPALDAFREAVAGLVRPALDARRWVPAPGESERERELRALLIAALGDLARDDTTVAAARELLARELAVAGSVDADVLGACVKVVAASGTAADLDTFVDRFERAPTPQEQLRFLYALASFPGAPEFQRVLALAASDAVRTQNAPFVLQRALRHPEHGPVAWRFVRDHWDGLVARFPANLVPRMLEGITWLVDDRCAADVPPFLSDHVVPEGEQIIAQHLERQALHRRLWEREHDRFAAAVIEGAAAARD